MNWWRSNNAQVSEPRKTRRQRARYRRGAHPKSMNALRKIRKFRLLRRSKVLLLIDDDKAEVGKPHCLAFAKHPAKHYLTQSD